MRAVTDRFVSAVDADDGDMACSLLAQDTAKALADDEGELCEDAARSLDLTAARVERAQVFGVSAKVDLADGSSAFLDLTPDGWRVAAAGCIPIGAEEPYECEVEA